MPDFDLQKDIQVRKPKNLCLITAMVPTGKASAFLEKLGHEKGIWSGYYIRARKPVVVFVKGLRAPGPASEVDEIYILCPRRRKNEIFAFAYDALDLNQPNNGFLTVTRVARGCEINIPKDPDQPHEDDDADATVIDIL
jgi:hypothetical protein